MQSEELMVIIKTLHSSSDFLNERAFQMEACKKKGKDVELRMMRGFRVFG
jgi:hypothetical protein